MRFRRSLAVVPLAVLALVTPAAQARPALDSPSHVSQTEAQVIASRGVGAPEPAGVTSSAPRVQSTDPGFDWASAAIGAGVGFSALALLALGAVSMGGRRHMRTARG